MRPIHGGRPFRRGEGLTSAELNEIVDQIMPRISGGKGVLVNSFGNRLIVSRRIAPKRRRLTEEPLIYSFVEQWDDEANPRGWTITQGGIDEDIYSGAHGAYGWFTTLESGGAWYGYCHNENYPTNPTLVNISAFDYPGLGNPAGGWMGLWLGEGVAIPDISTYIRATVYQYSPANKYEVQLRIVDGASVVEDYSGNTVTGEWPAWGTSKLEFAKTGPGAYSVSFQNSSLSVTDAHDIDQDLYPMFKYSPYGGRRVSYECGFATTEV